MKNSALKLFVSATSLVLMTSPALAAKYTVDAAHSKIGFSVKHMMISNVTGDFKEFEGTFDFDSKKDEVKDANLSVKTASIDTGNAKRDEHLRSPDFFDTAKFPTITLTNHKLKKAGKDKYKWTADMNMHGVTKPVTFDLEYRGSVKGMMGEMRAGFGATTKINRKDFGLTWNKALEAGGVAVSDEVAITLDVEATEASADPAAAASPAAKHK